LTCDTPSVSVLVPAPPPPLPPPSDTPKPQPIRNPDLVVHSLIANDSSSAWNVGCSNYSVALSPDFTIVNNGTGAASASAASLHIYDNSNLTTLLWSASSNVNVVALAAGDRTSGSASVSTTFSAQVITNSDFYLVLVVDTNNQLTESNEGNNTSSQRIDVSECTDIFFVDANVSFNVESETRNNVDFCQIVVNYDYTLGNSGFSNASQVDVDVSVSDGSSFSDTNITVLSGGQVTGGGVRDPYTEEQGSSVTRPAPSLIFTFTVTDDKDNNGSNNSLTRTLNFSSPTYSCNEVD
jgi:CARDB protein